MAGRPNNKFSTVHSVLCTNAAADYRPINARFGLHQKSMKPSCYRTLNHTNLLFLNYFTQIMLTTNSKPCPNTDKVATSTWNIILSTAAATAAWGHFAVGNMCSGTKRLYDAARRVSLYRNKHRNSGSSGPGETAWSGPLPGCYLWTAVPACGRDRWWIVITERRPIYSLSYSFDAAVGRPAVTGYVVTVGRNYSSRCRCCDRCLSTDAGRDATYASILT